MLIKKSNKCTKVWDELTQTLTIDPRRSMSEGGFYMIGGWKQNLRVDYVLGKPPSKFKSAFILDDKILNSQCKIVRAWRKTIPVYALEAARFLPNDKLKILSICSQSKPMKQLLISNPLLLWILYNHSIKRVDYIKVLHDLLSSKQHEALRKIGYPEAKPAWVKVLRKFRNSNLSAIELNRLIQLLRVEKTLAHLCHTTSPESQLIHILTMDPLLSDHSVKNLLDSAERDRAYSLIQRIYAMTVDRNRLYNCSSLRKLDALCTELSEQAITRRVATLLKYKYGNQIQDVKFPDPPLKGTPKIQHISSLFDLLRESQEMSHCIMSYAAQMIAGSYFAYSVSHPERATVGIRAISHSKFEIDEIRCAQNRRASPNTEAFISKWFSSKNNLNLEE